MYFAFFKPPHWRKISAEARRRNCAVMPFKEEMIMRMERTVVEIDGDYAVLRADSGEESRTALALLPDGLCEGMRLIFENFEWCVAD